MSRKTADLRYIENDRFIDYAFMALSECFNTREDFVRYLTCIPTDELKNKFLRISSFYLFLVKRGDWCVDVDGSDSVVDYLTSTYKYIAIFSLIESLCGEEHIDFYQYITGRQPKIEFPMDKSALDETYDEYKDEYGATRRCIAFFRALKPESQAHLLSKIRIKTQGNYKEATIEDLAKYLYLVRSRFVHCGELILNLSDGTVVGRYPGGNKIVISQLSMKDMTTFFEEGLIDHFKARP